MQSDKRRLPPIPGFVEPFGLVASLVTLVYTAFEIFFGSSSSGIPLERYVFLTIYVGFFLYFLYRVIRSLRSERYRQSLSLQHYFHHHLRDFYDVFNTNWEVIERVRRDCASIPVAERESHLRRLENAEACARKVLQDAIQEIEACFWHVTAKRVCVCLKYIALSESDGKRIVARTLLRDGHSAGELAEFDEAVIKDDLDDLSRNNHFSALFSHNNGRWVLRYASQKDTDKLMPHKDVRRGYEAVGMKIPTESLLMASISLKPCKWEALKPPAAAPLAEAHNAQRMPPPMAASSSDKHGDDHSVKPANRTTRTVGILVVESPSKKAFHRSDEELVFGFSDALYWPVNLYNRLSFSRKMLEDLVSGV